MKPVDQTTFGMPGGNCWSACVASLLDLSIEEVPYFLDDWPRAFDEWALARGFYTLTTDCDHFTPPGLHILGGQSPRDISHAVVAHGDRIVHDPHPGRGGLRVREKCTMLIPLDPSVPLR